jgi:hypothetical protein
MPGLQEHIPASPGIPILERTFDAACTPADTVWAFSTIRPPPSARVG